MPFATQVGTVGPPYCGGHGTFCRARYTLYADSLALPCGDRSVTVCLPDPDTVPCDKTPLVISPHSHLSDYAETGDESSEKEGKLAGEVK